MPSATTNWIETYRGTVPPWECDVTEHFTIAYYFDRLEEAEPNLADALGLGERWRGRGLFPPAGGGVGPPIWARRNLPGGKDPPRARVRPRGPPITLSTPPCVTR